MFIGVEGYLVLGVGMEDIFVFFIFDKRELFFWSTDDVSDD